MNYYIHWSKVLKQATVTQALFLSTNLRSVVYLSFFLFMPLYTSAPLHFRGKCTFYLYHYYTFFANKTYEELRKYLLLEIKLPNNMYKYRWKFLLFNQLINQSFFKASADTSTALTQKEAIEHELSAAVETL